MTRTSLMRPLVSALTAVICVLGLGLGTISCSSTGNVRARDDVPPIRVVFRDFRSNLSLTLINDAWLVARGIEGANAKERKLAYSSNPTGLNAQFTKVTSDADLDIYVQGIGSELHLNDRFLSGPVGETSVVYTTAIEITEGTSIRYVGNGPSVNSTLSEKQNYKTAQAVFVEMYNYNYSLQAVDDPFGGGLQR